MTITMMNILDITLWGNAFLTMQYDEDGYPIEEEWDEELEDDFDEDEDDLDDFDDLDEEEEEETEDEWE